METLNIRERENRGNNGRTPETKKKQTSVFCEQSRELAATDKQDCVQCDVWSHPSCYRIMQKVVSKDEVPFVCYFFFGSTRIMYKLLKEDENRKTSLRSYCKRFDN